MLSALLALQLLASSQTAPAVTSDPAAPPVAKQPQVVTWYGLQTLIADGTATVLTGGSPGSSEEKVPARRRPSPAIS